MTLVNKLLQKNSIKLKDQVPFSIATAVSTATVMMMVVVVVIIVIIGHCH